MPKICKKRVHGYDKKKFTLKIKSDSKKCPGLLHFTLLHSMFILLCFYQLLLIWLTFDLGLRLSDILVSDLFLPSLIDQVKIAWSHNVLTEVFNIAEKSALFYEKVKFLTSPHSSRYHRLLPFFVDKYCMVLLKKAVFIIFLKKV